MYAHKVGSQPQRFYTGVAKQKDHYLDRLRGSVLHQDGGRKRGNKHLTSWLG